MCQLVAEEALHFRLQAVLLRLAFSGSCVYIGSMYTNYKGKLRWRAEVVLPVLMGKVLLDKPNGVNVC